MFLGTVYTLLGWLLPPGPALVFPIWIAPVLAGSAAVMAVLVGRLTREPWPVALGRVTLRRVVTTALTLIATALFLRAFMAWKAALPRWHPYTYDAQLATLGAALHGGDAWHRLPAWLPLYDGVYVAWFPVVALLVTWMAWRGDTRYAVAFTLTWVLLGTVLPLLLPAAGPIFFQEVTGSDRFTPLTARLAGAPLSQLAREAMWSRYAAGVPSSISAFPSLHIAMLWLGTLAAWRVSRPAAVGLAGYTVLVLVASVGLGWHYALDGYASLLLVPLIWWVSGRLLGSKPRNRGRGRLGYKKTAATEVAAVNDTVREAHP